MPRVIRWSVCLVVCALVAASAPVRSETDETGFWLKCPRQWVEVPDENGTVRLAQFEAELRAYEDGRVRGGAVLHLGNKRIEGRMIVRLVEIKTDGPDGLAVTLEVVIEIQGTIANLLIDKGFGFIRDESGIEHFHTLDIDLDLLLPDVRDGVVYDMLSFKAEGTLQYRP